MESIIDDKIYNLSVQKENFELIFDINQRYNSLIERLFLEFWSNLFLHLKSKDKNLQNIVNKDWIITIKPKGWDFFKIHIEWPSDEHINYGIFSEQIKFRSINKINADFENIYYLNTFEYDDSGKQICFYKELNDNFTKLSGIVKMLPENRSELYDEIYLNIVDLIENMDVAIKASEANINNR